MKRRELVIAIVLTIVIAFMDISGLPGVLLFQIAPWDIDPFIFPLMINFVLIGILAFIVLKWFCPNWRLGLSRENLTGGLKRYAPAGAVAGALSFLAFVVGLPFDYQPTVWKILFEGILYYVGVAAVEELYVRGLFLNAVEQLFEGRENKANIAVVVSAVVFGLGHVPGMLGMGLFVIAFKVISTIGMGLYFGTVYKKTNNLWVPIILHALIDICALPYCFTTYIGYPAISLVILSVTYVGLGIYSIWMIKHEKL